MFSLKTLSCSFLVLAILLVYEFDMISAPPPNYSSPVVCDINTEYRRGPSTPAIGHYSGPVESWKSNRNESQQGLYVYNQPRDQLTYNGHFIHERRKRTRGHMLVAVDDFNVPHTAWGYAVAHKKGATDHDAAQQHGLT
ncbi:hypothetical protein MTO96_039571, partial [Rhipicephalus appendiculatus]